MLNFLDFYGQKFNKLKIERSLEKNAAEILELLREKYGDEVEMIPEYKDLKNKND